MARLLEAESERLNIACNETRLKLSGSLLSIPNQETGAYNAVSNFMCLILPYIIFFLWQLKRMNFLALNNQLESLRDLVRDRLWRRKKCA